MAELTTVARLLLLLLLLVVKTVCKAAKSQSSIRAAMATGQFSRSNRIDTVPTRYRDVASD
jgi:hypothetical protein